MMSYTYSIHIDAHLSVGLCTR